MKAQLKSKTGVGVGDLILVVVAFCSLVKVVIKRFSDNVVYNLTKVKN